MVVLPSQHPGRTRGCNEYTQVAQQVADIAILRVLPGKQARQSGEN